MVKNNSTVPLKSAITIDFLPRVAHLVSRSYSEAIRDSSKVNEEWKGEAA
jgi:hypothetical protein